METYNVENGMSITVIDTSKYKNRIVHVSYNEEIYWNVISDDLDLLFPIVNKIAGINFISENRLDINKRDLIEVKYHKYSENTLEGFDDEFESYYHLYFINSDGVILNDEPIINILTKKENLISFDNYLLVDTGINGFKIMDNRGIFYECIKPFMLSEIFTFVNGEAIAYSSNYDMKYLVKENGEIKTI